MFTKERSPSMPDPSTPTPEEFRKEMEKKKKKLEWVARKELEYAKDPYKIAIQVNAMLAKGRFEEALTLVQHAGRKGQVVVGWNHLIDYLFREQKLHAAIKLFNDMKKRAQLPNAQTYTIIFRGCANSMHAKTALLYAIKIFTQMKSSTRLKPNTIHLNAVLECCARAGDLESLFTVLSGGNDGLRSPNNLTYTIIFNALQHRPKPNSGRPTTGLDEEVQRQIETSIQRARAIWDEVVSKWKKGLIVIDEELACAMGRCLLHGSTKDNEDILALVEQTMRIPRPDVAEAEKEQNAHALSSSEPSNKSEHEYHETVAECAQDVPFQLATGQQESATALEEAAITPPEEQSLAAPEKRSLTTPTRKPFSASPASSGAYAKPGSNALGMIMEALINIRKTTLGPKYWKLLTRDHGVIPDQNNYNCYLRLLRNGRASARAADVIQKMPKELVSVKTFRLGFSTCIHDNLNRHSYQHACFVLNVMLEALPVPDPQALRMYLQASTGNVRHFFDVEKTDPDRARLALGKQLAGAVDRLWQPLRTLQRSFSFPEGNFRSPESEWLKKRDSLMEMLKLARRMHATMDKIVQDEMAEPDVLKVIQLRRKVLNRTINQYYDKMNAMEEGSGAKGVEKERNHRYPDAGSA